MLLKDQFTPVTVAAQEGHTSIVDMLIAHGANVNHVAAVSFIICNICNYLYVRNEICQKLLIV